MGLRTLYVVFSLAMHSGCIGSVVKTVVTAPIKATAAVIDASTTSQAEADRNRGREIRKQEEREEKERKRKEKKALKTLERNDL